MKGRRGRKLSDSTNKKRTESGLQGRGASKERDLKTKGECEIDKGGIQRR